MAEIKVEKKDSSILPWLLLGAGLVALLFWILTDADDSNNTYADGELYEEGYELGDPEEDGLIEGYDNDPFEENEVLGSNGEKINQNGEIVTVYDDDMFYEQDEDVIAAMDDADVEKQLFGNQYDVNTSVQNAVAFLDADPNKMGLHHEYSNRALNKLINATAAIAADRGVDVEDNLRAARKNAVAITKNPYGSRHADQIKAAAQDITAAIEKVQSSAYSSVDVSELRDAYNDINVQTLALDQKEDITNFYSVAVEAIQEMR